MSPEREVKNCALPWLTIRPDPAAVEVDNALHGGQTNARARKLSSLVQASKRSEERARVRHVKTHSVVAHKKHGIAVLLASANLNVRFGAGTGELHCVVQQVCQRD